MDSKKTKSSEALDQIMARLKEATKVPLEPFAIDFDEDPDFEKMLNDAFAVPLDCDFEKRVTPSEASPSATTPGVIFNGTRPVTIRIPHRIINAYKKHADLTGTGYQTLMVRMLDIGIKSFSVLDSYKHVDDGKGMLSSKT